MCSTDLQPPTQQQIAYLAGFFDGDGCVASAGSRRASCLLYVGQSCDGAETLMAFESAFGGTIYRHSHGVGLTKPSLQWILRGRAARSAARLLLPHSVVKRKQLRMAVDWPRQAADRECWHRELRSLKQNDSAEASVLSWEYFTGFFDAEGSIVVRPLAGIELRVNQKHVTVLECLQKFLASDARVTAGRIRAGSKIFFWQLSKTSECKRLIATMLACGMTRKAEQAKLALRLTLSNAEEVRCTMHGHAGNQKFAARLDSPGRARACEIKWLCTQKLRAKQPQMARFLAEDLARRRSEHALLKAQTENAQLQDYIHKLLKLQASSILSSSPGSAD